MCADISEIVDSFRVLFLHLFQARAVLEREFNNLLVVGTDRRFDEVSVQLDNFSSCLHVNYFCYTCVSHVVMVSLLNMEIN